MIDLVNSAPAALWLAAGVFAAYFMKSVIEALSRRREESQAAERLICALYAEIKANSDDMAEFLSHSAPVKRVQQAVRDNADFRPHITNAPHRLVYGSHITELASLPRAVILNVVAFYCQLERLSELTYGLDRPSYKSISQEGRAGVIAELWRATERGVSLGREVLHGLEIHAPLELMRTTLSGSRP